MNQKKSLLKEMGRMLSREADPNRLHTVTMSELYEVDYASKPALVENLLYTGAYIFAGSPKVGKSFFMLQLGYHISKGLPLWDFDVKKGKVLYLALEDDYKRLQKRLFRMFGEEDSEDLILGLKAGQIGNNLQSQLENFVDEYPDTVLIIIDTLQKVRQPGTDKYSYAGDYSDIAMLKNFAESRGITLMLVHHTRKQMADDKFDMISGTNGLMGAADGAFMLYKEKRTDSDAVLEVSGRDQQDQRLYLKRNEDTLAWELERKETEIHNEPQEPILDLLPTLLDECGGKWSGTATELLNALKLEIKPNTLSLKLNYNADRLLVNYGISFESSRTHEGRNIKLIRQNLPEA